MAGTEETGAARGEWKSVLSSPKGLFSAFVADGFGSRSYTNASEACKPTGDGERGIGAAEGSESLDASKEVCADSTAPTGRNGGSIAERRAARCGFSAPRINTARFRSVGPLGSPGIRSPYLTIPPGLSPTTLLDSPVMLSNSQAQTSPTTGSFHLPSFTHESPIGMSIASDTDKDNSEDSSAFMFKPHPDAVPTLIIPNDGNKAQKLMGFKYEPVVLKHTNSRNFTSDSFPNVNGSNCLTENAKSIAPHTCPPSITDQAHQPCEDPPSSGDIGTKHIVEEDQKAGFSSMGMGRPSEDGFNWRKYGQKQVKGSEYPRSYYKCTHPNCQVKKKVERSHDGQITEIIYKGAHSHAKPQPSRRSAIGSTFSLGEMSDSLEGSITYARGEGGSIWRGIQPGSNDKGGGDWRCDGLERTSSASVVTDASDPLSTAQGKQMNVFESVDRPELSSALASHDDDEDGATQRSLPLGDDDEDDESESKRRKIEGSLIEMNLASRSVREPRVVVQTDSDVDILDDGYRWRKYGQKVVKGNPNPRSYYKCTNAGCTVRKHVERASHDLKSVITTYEGKHNHEVPAARNNNHLNSGASTGSAPPTAYTASALSVASNIPKPEPRVQDLAPHFERKPESRNNYLKPEYVGSFTGDIKLCGSSSYDIKLPPALQASISLGSFVHSEAPQATSVAPGVPDFPISFPSINFPRSASLSLPGFDFNPGKPITGAQPFMGYQPKESDIRFLTLKQEKDDGSYEAQLPVGHPENASYRQIMGGFTM
ncbi:probable WRKY transcription factor 2 isoform X2 [Aristolochia californica]|uniref:probable WRKY transcription factor 2 isoform X2 n=1 Tax=Aristolochia californica TaxID=171875 RepID=UPI0035DF8013